MEAIVAMYISYVGEDLVRSVHLWFEICTLMEHFTSETAYTYWHLANFQLI